MNDDLKSLLAALRAAKEHDALVEPGFVLEVLEQLLQPCSTAPKPVEP